MRISHHRWITVIQVDQSENPWLQLHASRKQLQRDIFFHPDLANYHHLHQRPTPLTAQQIESKFPFPIRIPDAALDKFIKLDVRSWTDAITPSSWKRLQAMINDITKEEEVVAEGRTVHRWRRLCHIPTQHVVITFEYNYASVEDALRSGLTIILRDSGLAYLFHNAPKQSVNLASILDLRPTPPIASVGWTRNSSIL